MHKLSLAHYLSGLVLSAALLVSSCGDSGRSDGQTLDSRVGKQPSAASSPLKQTGRWFTDPQGRVVTLHGMNMMNKLPPYLSSAMGFGDDDARFLAREGFNFLRLGVSYARIEPEPGVFDDRYIEAIAREVETLTRHGIFVQLSSDNNCYGSKFGGQGMPDWMGLDDGLPSVGASQGFPTCYFVFADPGMNRAWDHFWANDPAADGIGLQDHYISGWVRLAKRLSGNSLVLGYDHLNEPWAGSDAATCANPAGCPQFEIQRLTQYMRKMTTALKKADPNAIVFAEPQLLFDFGARSWLDSFGEGNVGFSFHSYCIPELLGSAYGVDSSFKECESSDSLVLANALERATATNSVPFMTEFGATDVLDTLERVANSADKVMLSWAHWTYFGQDPCCARPQEGVIHDIRKPPEGDNLKQEKLDRLVRPYPIAVAGTPLNWSFISATKVFVLEYSTSRANGNDAFGSDGITEIFVPQRHYPKGYDVAVENGTVQRSGDMQLLHVKAAPAAKRVTLRITAKSK